MLTLLVFVVVLSVLVIVHEFGHFIAAKKAGVRVEIFSLGLGRKLLSKKLKDTEYMVSAVPLGGYVKLAGDNFAEYKGQKDEYLAQPLHKRFNIVFCGPLLNFILGVVLLWFIFYTGYPRLTTTVETVKEGLGAHAAGIISGDKIVAVNGQRIEYWDQLLQAVQRQKNKESVEITVLRETKEGTLKVALTKQSVSDMFGQKRTMPLLGIMVRPEVVVARESFLRAGLLSIQRTYELTILTYKALWYILARKLSVKESVTGPLGMFYITGKAMEKGFSALLQFVAILSISLGIFNLLPLPALDGGHIALLLIEKIRRKPLNQKIEEWFSRIGFGLIIAVAVLVFYNDLVRFGVIDKITQLFKK